MVELTPKQQIVDIVKNGQNFLLLTHEDPDGDAIGSLLALHFCLNRLGKNVFAYSKNIMPKAFSFLPQIDSITKDLNVKRDFIISVDISSVKADKVMYKVRDNRLDILLTPKTGKFDPKMVKIKDGSYGFDAIIVLDSPDLERIGEFYDKNSALFYETPIINIDHHPGNDNFGKVNLVDLTATSTSEILVSLIESITGDSKFFDSDMATALLTGIITDTNSFQNTNTTPKSLTVAAQLVAAGAHQQEIIKNIYKTKPLTTLRLWGKALTNIHDEKEYRFVWSELYVKDYLDANASPEESGGLIDELLKTASNVDFALLLSEKDEDVHGSLRSINATKDVSKIAALFDGGGHTLASGFQLKKTTLMDKSEEIIRKIKEYQKTAKD